MYNKKSPWKTISSAIVYHNPWFKVRKDKVIRPDSKKGEYNIVETPGPSVFIVALNKDNKILLIKQFRYPTNMWSWEVPGGNAENNPVGEAAKREFWEESGLKAENWQEIGIAQAMNGVCSEVGHTFIATDLLDAPGNKKEEEGISETKWVNFEEIFEMIKNGEITDSQSIAALIQAAIYLQIINC